MQTLLAVVFGVVSVLLVIIVLLQAGKGAGMGLFGGGGSNTTFGAQSGDILTKITTWLGIFFFGIALVFALAVSKDDSLSGNWKKKGKGKIVYGKSPLTIGAERLRAEQKKKAQASSKKSKKTNAKNK